MSSSDFFRNFQSLFESQSSGNIDALNKKSRGLLAKKDGDKALAGVKKKIDDEYGSDKNKDPKTNKTEDGEEVYETKQASNVKETAGAFFRRYSDIIKEAEDKDDMTSDAEDEQMNAKDDEELESDDHPNAGAEKKKEWVPPWKKDGKKDDKK